MAASLWWDDPSPQSSKSEQQNKLDDLFVFGYACKLFRDDDKAREIDNGKLLIPWMGDESLLIDRYDGRGHLYDLSSHDADLVVDKNPQLSEEEEAVEKACDEERYLELHTDVQEAAMYEEEEWKRYYLSLQEGYQAVGFSYDNPQGGDQTQDQLQAAAKEEEDEPFVVPEELCVPPDMIPPKCKKHNARIVKTASFIAQHGIQMEIMLKTKQAGNSQFDFLHFENELNPYYKHVVSMIKSNKYKPVEEDQEEKHDEDSGHGYLHPSLSAPSLPPPPPPPSKPIELPKVSIHDTPYGALIKSIKKNSVEIPQPAPVEETPIAQSQPRSQLPHIHSYPELPSYPHHPPPPGTEPISLPMVSSLNGQAFVEQLYSQPLPPGTEPSDYPDEFQTKKPRKRRHRSDSSDSSSSSSSSSSSAERKKSKKKTSKSNEKTKVLRAEGPNPIAPPPPDVQPIIDRMAMYVAKNGAEFEMVVMSRKDPRFQFLNEYHAYYPYYKLMKDSYVRDLAKQGADQEEKSDKSDQGSQRSVSFSIRGKAKEQDAASTGSTKPKSTTLFQYDSSEGEEDSRLSLRDPSSEAPSNVASPSVRVSPDDDREMAEKLKDKLASAVKERLSQGNKEKQLQAERKKKAAMFLNLLKSQEQPSQCTEDSASLYVGQGSPAPIVYEYDNRPTPKRLESDRKKSSKEKKRRKRSPTPPSAYSLDRRSPTRPSPSRWGNRPNLWSSVRDRSPQWSRRGRELPKRSRSRSPHRKEEKRKKHKRSKSRSPSRKTKDKSRSHKSKDKDKKKEKKSKRRSKDKDSNKTESSHANGRITVIKDDSSSDLELLEPSEIMDNSVEPPALPKAFSSSTVLTDLSSIPIPSASNSKTVLTSESAEDVQSTASTSQTTSLANSPSTQSSTATKPTLGYSSSSDLMSKVRAMLKKSREIALKEDTLLFEGT